MNTSNPGKSSPPYSTITNTNTWITQTQVNHHLLTLQSQTPTHEYLKPRQSSSPYSTITNPNTWITQTQENHHLLTLQSQTPTHEYLKPRQIITSLLYNQKHQHMNNSNPGKSSPPYSTITNTNTWIPQTQANHHLLTLQSQTPTHEYLKPRQIINSLLYNHKHQHMNNSNPGKSSPPYSTITNTNTWIPQTQANHHLLTLQSKTPTHEFIPFPVKSSNFIGWDGWCILLYITPKIRIKPLHMFLEWCPICFWILFL